MKRFGDFIVFFVKGEGFLRGMIRTLIGTSLAAAKNQISLEDIQNALNGAELPDNAWKPVPAEGLYFKRAHYPQK